MNFAKNYKYNWTSQGTVSMNGRLCLYFSVNTLSHFTAFWLPPPLKFLCPLFSVDQLRLSPNFKGFSDRWLVQPGVRLFPWIKASVDGGAGSWVGGWEEKKLGTQGLKESSWHRHIPKCTYHSILKYFKI